MKRQTAAKSKKSTMPSIRKKPAEFEKAFAKRMGQSPEDFVFCKLQGGSAVNSVEYLFEIVSAEVARSSLCAGEEFACYYGRARERIQAMKKHTVYNKLVRDKIPEIIEASGKTCTVAVLPDDAYIQALDAKLNEELAEYQQSKSLEELADLLEVMGAVVKARGYSWEELTQVRKAKRAQRGGFDRKLLLKEVVE